MYKMWLNFDLQGGYLYLAIRPLDASLMLERHVLSFPGHPSYSEISNSGPIHNICKGKRM